MAVDRIVVGAFGILLFSLTASCQTRSTEIRSNGFGIQKANQSVNSTINSDLNRVAVASAKTGEAVGIVISDHKDCYGYSRRGRARSECKP